MSSIMDGATHAGLLLTGPADLSRVDLVRLNTLVEAFELSLVSPVEVAGISLGETMDLIAARRAA